MYIIFYDTTTVKNASQFRRSQCLPREPFHCVYRLERATRCRTHRWTEKEERACRLSWPAARRRVDRSGRAESPGCTGRPASPFRFASGRASWSSGPATAFNLFPAGPPPADFGIDFTLVRPAPIVSSTLNAGSRDGKRIRLDPMTMGKEIGTSPDPGDEFRETLICSIHFFPLPCPERFTFVIERLSIRWPDTLL